MPESARSMPSIRSGTLAQSSIDSVAIVSHCALVDSAIRAKVLRSMVRSGVGVLVVSYITAPGSLVEQVSLGLSDLLVQRLERVPTGDVRSRLRVHLRRRLVVNRDRSAGRFGQQ